MTMYEISEPATSCSVKIRRPSAGRVRTRCPSALGIATVGPQNPPTLGRAYQTLYGGDVYLPPTPSWGVSAGTPTANLEFWSQCHILRCDLFKSAFPM